MNVSRKQTSNVNLTRRDLLKHSLYGGLAASLSPCLWLSGCSKNHDSNINIVLITIDTVRADHLSCYGYRRRTSPNLDKLAAESVLYSDAISTSSWTLPSHASLFTGKFTSSHGARYDPQGPLYLTDAISGPKAWRNFRARSLGKDEVTLAQILKQAGYETGALVGGPWLKRIFHLNKGFNYYDDEQISTLNGRLARHITDRAAKWINEIKEKYFFLFLNYFDPHHPYLPPKNFAGVFLPEIITKRASKKTTIETTIARYDAEILYMDYHIGKFLEQLKAYGLYDNTMIVVVSDHGEMFGKHGKVGHGDYLYQELIHVPLFVKYPFSEVSPKQTNVPIQINDIFAVILNRLGIEIPQDTQASMPPQIEHPVLAEVFPLEPLSKDGHWRAIFDEDYKFIWNSKKNHQLFNLKNDPHENDNLVSLKPNRVKKMLTELNKYLGRLPKPGPPDNVERLDEQTKEALKSLGYVK
jgi:arylsulfatase A-like enzyme